MQKKQKIKPAQGQACGTEKSALQAFFPALCATGLLAGNAIPLDFSFGYVQASPLNFPPLINVFEVRELMSGTTVAIQLNQRTPLRSRHYAAAAFCATFWLCKK